VVAKDLEHQHSHDKLVRTEISTLIGLMVQRPIDMTLPEPKTMQLYIERTEFLLNELHRAMERHWFEGWDLGSGKMPEHDPFTNAAGMREPIFYSGESAYNFQYRDLARLKYGADDRWLEDNKGFRIDEACQISDALGRLQCQRQTECARAFRKQPPDQWTMLPGFKFVTQEVADASGVAAGTVQRFLDVFSCGPDESNVAFTALNEFNNTNSAPILRTGPESYILLQHFSLLEAVYESPFYWMAADKAYSSTALTNRGRFTERFVADRLEAVFGPSRVLRNVDIYKGKSRIAEADALVLFGDRAIVVQAKSKRLTLEARKGNDLQLKDDFKKAVQDSYDQAVLCAEALTSDGFRFVVPSDAEIALARKPRIVFPICIVSDHYPALAFQARQFLRTTVTTSIQPPLVTDVFALDAFAEMLNTPLHFLNYLALRARFGDKLVTTHELTTLGFHLRHNLWLDAQYDGVVLEDSLASTLDIAMLARRSGVPGATTPKGILTRFENLTIGRLLAEIERADSPQLTGLGLLLLQLSSETAKALSACIDRVVRDAKRDGNNHDISTAVDAGNSGLTLHCNCLPDHIAREHLSAHCRLRKHDAKASAWYGVLLHPDSGGIRGALIIEEDWKPDPRLEAAMAAWPRRPPVPISQLVSQPKKVRRNDLCPCGSGRKYKKCCGS
jgi:SEC-C motif